MILMALAPLALASLAGPAAGATATPSDTPAGCSSWNGSQPADPSDSSIDGLAAVSPCNVWAVGGAGDPVSPLIEHWDGSSWTVVPPPDPDGSGYLTAVAAASARDIWAVGNAAGGTPGPLFLHYDGSAWTQVPRPVLGGDTTLASVDAVAANDAWTSGVTFDANGDGQAVILHWNGTRWSQATLPPEFTRSGTSVDGISADSATDAWAAINGPGTVPSMLRWGGTSWTPVPFPAPPTTFIYSVSAVSPSSAWAVGRQGILGSTQPVVMHWDGTSWAQVASPSFGVGLGSWLDTVVAISDTSVFALGLYAHSYTRLSANLVPLVLHWDGSSWAGAALPVPGQGVNTLNRALGVTAAGQAWAAVAAGPDPNHGPFTQYAAPVPAVPDVTGRLVGEANATLGTFGLTANSVLNQTTNCPASSHGLIVGQDPAAGQQEPFGFAVTLTQCATPETVAVPSVLSQGDQDAQNAITAAGLTVGPVTMRANCTEPRGAVLIQNPDPGVQVTPGTAVSLVESTGRQPNGHLCVIN
jgi:hypothetical protein